ncbi:MAG: hypothetical protein H6Q77_1190 [Gemmatimonadetes bacterium]|nr:hypothetical protein [Gemmatimonadota bacterium]
MISDLTSLRRALAAAGITPASVVPAASADRREEAEIHLAQLVEGDRVEALPIGDPVSWPGPVAFLDGVQHSEVVGYAGSSPIVVASAAAAVRERTDRVLATRVMRRRDLAIGRRAALDAAGPALDALERVELSDADPPHPIRELAQAGAALDDARGALEVAVGVAYRGGSSAWLVVDGSLAESPVWARDPRMVGVAKSHSSLPFDGADLESYLRLPVGYRSPIFAPASRRLAPVRAWAVRLWPWEGKDLLHGLIRVEVAPASGTPETADRISRWLMAERAPISAPDPRWDRMLYGIRSVEEFLRATA